MTRRKITEETDKPLLEAWKKRQPETPRELGAFVRELVEDYDHDYGTIIHAMHAAMVAAFQVIQRGPQGGITGFQANCLMWMLVEEFGPYEEGAPLRLVNMNDMLFPQYAHKFSKTIPGRLWSELQERAKESLADEEAHAHPDVVRHWKSIVAGRVPFGYTVEPEN